MQDYTKANELYEECLADACVYVIDPVKWLWHQTKMRKSWEDYKSVMNKNPEIIRHVMMNNSLSRYMDYMYDTYPEGIDIQLKNEWRKVV